MELNEFDFEVQIRCPRFPTENKETLIRCLSKVFPKTDWDIGKEEIEGRTEYLTRFKKILKDMKIRDTARKLLKSRATENQCTFSLNKQATCNEKVNFSEEEQPLGKVEVIIECGEIEELIQNLTETEE